jgi:CRISPR-associated endonuclease/helicase Cas3
MGAEKLLEGSRAVEYLRFWGKAQPLLETGPRWHPIAFHLLDVAASAKAILAARPVTRARAARFLAMKDSEATALVVALAGLHDLGKFARAFQAKCPELWPSVLGPLDAHTIPSTHHTQDGLHLWEHHLSGRLVDSQWLSDIVVLLPLMQATFGHHGKPAGPSLDSVQWVFGGGGLQAAEGCARDVLALLEPVSGIAGGLSRRFTVASWWIGGIISLADWIGSSQEWFPYADPSVGLRAYWLEARNRAVEAVLKAGLVPPAPATRQSFAELTGESKWEPTPTQTWAEGVPIPDGPILVLLEDVTGAGKTEVAQMLVHRLLCTGRASGAYWAMPTQATANAMFDRQGKAIQNLFESRRQPSLALAHGQALLHEGFRDSVIPAGRLEAPFGNDDEELPASAACAAFLADDRRRSLLADVGVGTVDQAFLAVWPSKFNTIRLAGLADKVLILDEAHAYDAYMGIEASTLLRFHAALGGHAIVLSATLPKRRREELAQAWRKGADPYRKQERILFPPPEADLVASEAYPLATIVSPNQVVETPIPAPPRLHRTVKVRMVHEFAAAVREVVDGQRQGGAVAWVRNTVDDCLAAAAALEERGLDPIVFHARFAQADRQAREAEVRQLFDMKATPSARWGKVLVATQVVEQSLDLDFDLLITDLAPMDLVIQRAGRLWRHPERNRDRPSGLSCEMVVLGPIFVEEPDKHWLSGEFAGTAAVYRNPGVLWLTSGLLAKHGEIRSPDCVRSLVEGTYQTDDVPPGLQARTDQADAADGADAATAQYAVLALEDGYGGSLRSWENDALVLTRLGDKQTVVRLARVGPGGALLPWAEAGEPGKAWALSEVKLRAKRVPFASKPEQRFARAVAEVRAGWGRFEQEVPILPLVLSEAGGWCGSLLRPDGRVVLMTYTTERGLAFAK